MSPLPGLNNKHRIVSNCVEKAGTNVATYNFIPLLLKSSDPRLIFVGGLAAINQASEEYFPTPPQPQGWPKPPVGFETIG